MDIFTIVGLVLILTAFFGVINYHYIKMPTVIGQTFIAMIFSLVLFILGKFGFDGVAEIAAVIVDKIDFNKTLMNGMLGPMLFSGALNVNINDLLEKKWEVGIFSTLGVIISAFIISGLMYLVFAFLEIFVPFSWCFVFGALISPTDPIAALGILAKSKTPKSLETKIVGESLFNDGVGIVLFTVALEIATGAHQFSWSHTTIFFLEEALGGAAFGFIAGYMVYKILKTIDKYTIEIMLTLALVFGIFAITNIISDWLGLHLSSPIAIVVAGLFIGNRGRLFAMSEKTRKRLDGFWELMDEMLNLIIFVLIGLELIVIVLSVNFIKAGIAGIVVVLSARLISVTIPVYFMKIFKRSFTKGVIKIMTWGGLRGGISIALALSLPSCNYGDVLKTVTFIVVGFSILFQGLTVKNLVKNNLS